MISGSSIPAIFLQNQIRFYQKKNINFLQFQNLPIKFEVMINRFDYIRFHFISFFPLNVIYNMAFKIKNVKN